MSNAPGAQAQANKHAGKNRPSDIDELRDNVADIAGRQYEQVYEVATDAVEETGQIIRHNPPWAEELGHTDAASLLQETLDEEEATETKP
jgi:phage I-like protein